MSYNAGLLFYKHYYEGIEFDGRDTARKEKYEEQNEQKFLAKNKMLLNTSFQSNLLPELEKLDPEGLGDFRSFPLTTSYPGLIIGTGYTHGSGLLGEFKTGFFFDYTTGMPVIPGSSVKGLLRSTFPLLYAEKADQLRKKGKNEEAEYWDHLADNRRRFISAILSALGYPAENGADFIIRLEREIFEGMRGNDREKAEDHFAMCDRDIFYDAVIVGSKTGLIFKDDYITPHKNTKGDGVPDALKNPTPIQFLKVMPEVSFVFQFSLKNNYQSGHFTRLLTSDQRLELFRQILLFLGTGAKTNTGYGQFVGKGRVDFGKADGSQTSTEGVAEISKPSVSKPFKKGDKVAAVVIEDPKTPPQYIALRLIGGLPEESIVAYLRFPAGRTVGTTASLVEIIDLKSPVKVTVLKW